MKGLERIIADMELELAGAEAVASGIRGALQALRGEREPRSAEAQPEAVREVRSAGTFAADEVRVLGHDGPSPLAGAEPWFPDAEPAATGRTPVVTIRTKVKVKKDAAKRRAAKPAPLAKLAEEIARQVVVAEIVVAPKKRRGRPPKAKVEKPTEKVEAPKRSKMISHLCHKCNNRTEWDPCHRCGAKVPVVSSLATMAPDIAHADEADA